MLWGLGVELCGRRLIKLDKTQGLISSTAKEEKWEGRYFAKFKKMVRKMPEFHMLNKSNSWLNKNITYNGEIAQEVKAFP